MVAPRPVRESHIKGLIGEVTRPGRTLTGCVISAETAQVSTITVGSATNGKQYSFVVDGVTITTAAADGSATTAEVAQLLADAFEAEPLVSGKASVSVASNVATFTARKKGTAGAFAISDDDAQLTTATTAAVDRVTVYPGRMVVHTAPSGVEGSGQYVCPPGNSDGVSVMEWTIDAVPVNDATIVVGIQDLQTGQIWSAPVTMDGSATAQEVAEAIDAALTDIVPAGLVTITEDDDVVTITGVEKGWRFGVLLQTDDTDVDFVVTTTKDDRYTSILSRFAGVLRRERLVQATAAGAYVLDPDQPLAVDSDCWMIVDVGAAPAAGTLTTLPVFVVVDSSGADGAFRHADASNVVDVSHLGFAWRRYLGAQIQPDGTTAYLAELSIPAAR